MCQLPLEGLRSGPPGSESRRFLLSAQRVEHGQLPDGPGSPRPQRGLV